MKRNYTIDELADEQSGSFSASIYEHTATTIMTSEEQFNPLSTRKQAEDMVKNDSQARLIVQKASYTQDKPVLRFTLKG